MTTRERIINMFFTQASHDHDSGTTYDCHYRPVYGAAEWTESKWSASGKSLQSCHKSHISFHV